MNKNYDLKILKKKYGNDFANLCKNLFPTLLEEEGVLSKIIEDNFAPSRFLYKDLIEQKRINDFKDYVFSKRNIEEVETKTENIETPEVLMDRVGYVLYKCETDEDVKSFRKYYAPGEELCTFRDANRINTNTIFFAVKKNVDKIKRENFTNPKREDEYGTSVISLQFTKGESSTLSIKNHYNHALSKPGEPFSNPDATFSNDLENIIAGLTESFEKHYGIKLGAKSKFFFWLDHYVQANDGKFYRYNYEYNNIYYCPNNVIIDNFEAKQYDKSRYEVFETFVLDKQTKKIFSVEGGVQIHL